MYFGLEDIKNNTILANPIEELHDICIKLKYKLN